MRFPKVTNPVPNMCMPLVVSYFSTHFLIFSFANTIFQVETGTGGGWSQSGHGPPAPGIAIVISVRSSTTRLDRLTILRSQQRFIAIRIQLIHRPNRKITFPPRLNIMRTSQPTTTSLISLYTIFSIPPSEKITYLSPP